MQKAEPEGGTRDRFLEAAARLFRRQGFSATSLKDVVAEANAPWGSLYHHFPGGKVELGVEAIRWSGDAFTSLITRTLAESDTAAAAARQMFSLAAEGLENSDYANGCPIANVTAEATKRSDPLRGACADVFDAWARVVATRLRAEGVESADADGLANFVVAAYEGAISLARARGDIAVMNSTAGHVVAAIEAATARSPSTVAPGSRS